MVPLNPTAIAPIAVLLGLLGGFGLWLVVTSVPRLGRPRLAERVAPMLVDISAEARAEVDRRPADPSQVFGVVVAPVLASLQRIAGATLGGNATIAKRLRQAGSETSVERFRAEQLACAAAAFALGALLAVFSPGLASMPLIVRIAVPFLAAVLGAIGRDWWLQRRAARRIAQIGGELPTVLEFLTLSLTAGEGMLDAIRRVSQTGSGALPGEFSRLTASVATGVPLTTALATLRDDIDHPALTRCLDQVLGALERGAPLAAVLRAQAGDVREESKRTIIEVSGKKEIAMLVPLIFLILPVTVAFALFPGYIVLQSGF
ncbi:type II secretion system F family protein [Agromyces archimandritae]|uniref:Type II secretion system F family protein n=1 Tax=Agromyces archimandritae TaxID=2781962 RepID=A0A975FLW7_9MICO|nr:type II secretion system F family protein [Agromyces archimandritae]QTX04316.1 type II secretion system F family protein [Agromyces archimandritae]